MKSIVFLSLSVLSAAFVFGQTGDMDAVENWPYHLKQSMALQDGYDGKNNSFLSQSMVKAMLA